MCIKIRDQSHDFFHSLWWLVTASVSSRAESKVCNCVASFSSSDKPTSHFIKMGNSKRVLGETKMNMQKRNKLVKLAVKLEPSTNGVYRRNSWPGGCQHYCHMKGSGRADTGTQGRPLIYQIKERKDEGVQRNWCQPKLPRKEFQEIVHNIESTEDEMLEADPNLERTMRTHKGEETMLPIVCCTAGWRREKLPSAPDKVWILDAANVFHCSV